MVYWTLSKTDLQFRFLHQHETSQRVDNWFTNTCECVCVRIHQDGSNTTVLGVEPILTPGVVVSWKLLLPFRLEHNYFHKNTQWKINMEPKKLSN